MAPSRALPAGVLLFVVPGCRMEDLNYCRVFNVHEVKSASVVCSLLLFPLGADFFCVGSLYCGSRCPF